jgi:hypothetical protein
MPAADPIRSTQPVAVVCVVVVRAAAMAPPSRSTNLASVKIGTSGESCQ